MARISDHPEIELDEASGKVPAQFRTPWIDFQPSQAHVDRLQERARKVLRSGARFSTRERDEALARLILGD